MCGTSGKTSYPVTVTLDTLFWISGEGKPMTVRWSKHTDPESWLGEQELRELEVVEIHRFGETVREHYAVPATMPATVPKKKRQPRQKLPPYRQLEKRRRW